MRKPCVGCTLKHLGAAAVLEHEMLHGYPNYGPYMWGHMEQAEEEIAAISPRFADVIRAHRVKSQYAAHSVPFDALIAFTYALGAAVDDADDGGAAALEIPADCLVGVTDDGVFTPPGDTRMGRNAPEKSE